MFDLPAAVAAYESRLNYFQCHLKRELVSNRHCIGLYIHINELPLELVKYLISDLKSIAKRESGCDFAMMALIRILFIAPHHDHCSEQIRSMLAKIESAFDGFPFWPLEDNVRNGKQHPKSLVFWSENHCLMFLSSAYLSRQHMLQKADPTLTNEVIHAQLVAFKETQILEAYLEGHCSPLFHGGGMYEVLSHVYLPHSLSALLNLFDFSCSFRIKQLSKRLIDVTIFQLLLGATVSNGVCNLTASCRTFDKMRLRNHNHNINQLMNLILGYSSDAFKAITLTTPLVTSCWRPGVVHFQALLARRISRMPMNPRRKDTLDLYRRLTHCEATPLYWSAGLVLHPKFTDLTSAYQDQFGMGKNVHLWPLWYIGRANLHSLSKHFKHFTKGQMYTGVNLNLYKHSLKGLCLSSFERFNRHLAGFQQNPWMAAVDGLPVWTQSGNGGKKGIASTITHGMINSHAPCVQQRGSVLVSTYLAPPALVSALGMVQNNLFGYKAKLYWPEDLFDEHRYVQYRPFGSSEDVGRRVAAFDDASVGSSSSSSDSKKKEKKKNKKDAESLTIPAYTWLVGRKGQAVIAVLCTQPTDRERDEKDKLAQLSLHGGDSSCVPPAVNEMPAWLHARESKSATTATAAAATATGCSDDEEWVTKGTPVGCSAVHLIESVRGEQLEPYSMNTPTLGRSSSVRSSVSTSSRTSVAGSSSLLSAITVSQHGFATCGPDCKGGGDDDDNDDGYSDEEDSDGTHSFLMDFDDSHSYVAFEPEMTEGEGDAADRSMPVEEGSVKSKNLKNSSRSSAGQAKAHDKGVHRDGSGNTNQFIDIHDNGDDKGAKMEGERAHISAAAAALRSEEVLARGIDSGADDDDDAGDGDGEDDEYDSDEGITGGRSVAKACALKTISQLPAASSSSPPDCAVKAKKASTGPADETRNKNTGSSASSNSSSSSNSKDNMKTMTRFTCNAFRHSWVVVVGTMSGPPHTLQCSSESTSPLRKDSTDNDRVHSVERRTGAGAGAWTGGALKGGEQGYTSSIMQHRPKDIEDREYASLDEFIEERCQKMEINETNGGSETLPKNKRASVQSGGSVSEKIAGAGTSALGFMRSLVGADKKGGGDAGGDKNKKNKNKKEKEKEKEMRSVHKARESDCGGVGGGQSAEAPSSAFNKHKYFVSVVDTEEGVITYIPDK